MENISFTNASRKSPLKRKYIIAMVAGIAILFGLYFFVVIAFRLVVVPVRVVGLAMKPTLNDGDKLLMRKNPADLARGDIVVFYFPKDRTKSYIKRIVGLPGETVDIKEGKVKIDGRDLEEKYLDPNYLSNDSLTVPIQIEKDHYFVLGDNRSNSSDSRSWGTVPKDLIYGKFLVKYYEAENKRK